MNDTVNHSWHRVVAHRYGPPSSLRIEPFTPPSPQHGEVRVRVEAAGVNAGDWHLLRASPAIVRLFFGLRRPKHPVLGSDVAGIVEEVGDGVTDLRVGDAVMGSLSTFGFGAFSQVVVKPSEAFVKMPAGISFEMAAAVPEAG
ncbi:MAG: alcohol dehydrogenase catalytic domain-containing protein, partial [Planctomycetota bacterium]